VLIIGDQVELRGPIGGYFVWEASMGGPLLLVAGGSGIVPLMAMIRHWRAASSSVPVRLLYSSKTIEDIIYRQELEELLHNHARLEVFYTLTREQSSGWDGYGRRIDMRMLEEVATPFGKNLRAYICGPTALVEGVANGLVALGIPPDRVRTERFGPTGGS
jgi:ferredoxin-NADP reductase